MNKATKACLLSAFVFPGAGQLYLKMYWRAAPMLILALVCLMYIVGHLLGFMSELLYQIQTGALAADIVSLLPKIHEYSQSKEGSVSGYLSWLLLGVWLSSLLDAWHQGRKHEALKPA